MPMTAAWTFSSSPGSKATRYVVLRISALPMPENSASTRAIVRPCRIEYFDPAGRFEEITEFQSLPREAELCAP